ncbi:hypothetical protein [Serratia nevei]|nr:hypothetical protein [Serratia nevei]MDK5913925.1 hypothetical protein [Serratia nevei]MDK6018214.1 hypothetical protein [Serratia nevei]MEC5566811.1 hypothetical protein [Serratia nevei]
MVRQKCSGIRRSYLGCFSIATPGTSQSRLKTKTKTKTKTKKQKNKKTKKQKKDKTFACTKPQSHLSQF